MLAQLTRRLSDSFQALLRPERSFVDNDGDKASSNDFPRGVMGRRYRALVLLFRQYTTYANVLLILLVILLALCMPLLIPPHSPVDLLSLTALYVVIQALPLTVRRVRPMESLVLVTVIAFAFRLWGPIRSLSTLPVWSWSSLFRTSAFVTILAASIAAYAVGQERVGFKRIVGAVSTIAVLSIIFLIASVGERFVELYRFSFTFLFVVTLAIGVGVTVRRRRGPAFATPTVVQRPTPRASVRALAIDRLLQGHTIEAVSREFSLSPGDILEWRSQLVQSTKGTDRTPSRESFWSRLGHWPAVAALLGLILYVPTYIAYEYFYGNLGVSPDEVGLNYANVLSRETTWLASSILILLAALGAFLLCFGAAARPRIVRHVLITRGLPAPSESTIRYSGLLVGLSLIALLVQIIIFQVNSVPRDVFDGVPNYANPRSFFRARVDFVEVSWIGDATPPGMPRRMLYLGQSGGVAVFWNAAQKSPIRLPASSITMTSVYAESVPYELNVMESGELKLSPWEPADGIPDEIGFWPFAVRRPARGEPDCSTEKWKEAVLRALPPYTKVVRVPDPNLFTPDLLAHDLLYVLPGYKSLSAQLVRAGAPLDKKSLRDGLSRMTQEELLAAARDARQNGRKLPLPCL